MMLSDVDIARGATIGRIPINPFDLERVQPASYDVALHSEFILPCESHPDFDRSIPLDPRDPEFDMLSPQRYAEVTIPPHGFLLGCTVERFRIPSDMAAVIDGKSSLGRMALAVHVTAGYVDPGWDGRLTLEILNNRPRPFKLYAGMPIGQVRFFELSSRAEFPYGSERHRSKYQGANGVQASRMHRNFDQEGQPL